MQGRAGQGRASQGTVVPQGLERRVLLHPPSGPSLHGWHQPAVPHRIAGMTLCAKGGPLPSHKRHPHTPSAPSLPSWPQWLKLLGIPASSIVPYDPAREYCAATLLLPTPTPRITPPREALLSVRRALGVVTLPEVRGQAWVRGMFWCGVYAAVRWAGRLAGPGCGCKCR